MELFMKAMTQILQMKKRVLTKDQKTLNMKPSAMKHTHVSRKYGTNGNQKNCVQNIMDNYCAF